MPRLFTLLDFLKISHSVLAVRRSRISSPKRLDRHFFFKTWGEELRYVAGGGTTKKTKTAPTLTRSGKECLIRSFKLRPTAWCLHKQILFKSLLPSLIFFFVYWPQKEDKREEEQHSAGRPVVFPAQRPMDGRNKENPESKS